MNTKKEELINEAIDRGLLSEGSGFLSLNAGIPYAAKKEVPKHVIKYNESKDELALDNGLEYYLIYRKGIWAELLTRDQSKAEVEKIRKDPERMKVIAEEMLTRVMGDGSSDSIADRLLNLLKSKNSKVKEESSTKEKTTIKITYDVESVEMEFNGRLLSAIEQLGVLEAAKNSILKRTM